ncbi:MAG: GAF domain-containing protein [Chloroflexi bacterium]|nr:GAF domain-containing protein [Chloroflexota bacterium]MBU1751397.1 GAF domain-containing protein [Chloroflexota bacterium]
MLKNLVGSIGVRLVGGYLLLAVLALVMGLIGYVQIGNVNNILAVETTERAETRYLGTKVRIECLQISELVESYVATLSAATKTRLRAQFTDELYILNEFVNQIEKRIGNTPEDRAVLSEIMQSIQGYRNRAQAVMDAYDTDDQVGSQTQEALAQFRTTRAQLLEQLTTFEDRETTRLFASRRTAQDTVDQAQRLIIALGVIILIGGVLLGAGISWTITRPVRRLMEAAQRIMAGDLEHLADVRSRSEIGVLARAFNEMTVQLRESIGQLEARITGRTVDLERRSVQLEAAARVAREAAAIRDVGQLMDATVHLISQQFGFYHAGIFLLALREQAEYAVLQAASSEGGQRMLARGHKLEVGQVGIVGYVADAGESRLALDVGEDAVFFDNPDLPMTRSEMALPLKVREQVIGVLDVQSTEEAAFTDEDVEVLQTMADQVALAIENARLLAESQRSLQELEAVYGQQTRRAWADRATRQSVAYRYTGTGVGAVSPTVQSDQAPDASAARRLSAPIRLRGQDIGSIMLQRDPDQDHWSPEEAALMEEVGVQIGLALENARLVEDTQRRAAREQLTGEVSTRMRETLDVDTVLRTTIREFSHIAGGARVTLRLGDAEALLAAASEPPVAQTDS